MVWVNRLSEFEGDRVGVAAQLGVQETVEREESRKGCCDRWSLLVEREALCSKVNDCALEKGDGVLEYMFRFDARSTRTHLPGLP